MSAWLQFFNYEFKLEKLRESFQTFKINESALLGDVKVNSVGDPVKEFIVITEDSELLSFLQEWGFEDPETFQEQLAFSAFAHLTNSEGVKTIEVSLEDFEATKARVAELEETVNELLKEKGVE